MTFYVPPLLKSLNRCGRILIKSFQKVNDCLNYRGLGAGLYNIVLHKAISNILLVSHPLVQHKLMRVGGDY